MPPLSDCIDTSTQEWQPELVTPKIAVYGIEDLGAMHGDGLALSRWLVERSTQISFPATDPSTRVDDIERLLRTFSMRYTGPNIFAMSEVSDEVTALNGLYTGAMLRVWRQEFNMRVRALDINERAAEAFITNPSRNEAGDPHNDTYVTCAGYPAPGAALIVSHCINARNLDDIQQQPSTLVLPRPQSLIFFQGTTHPHVGTSPNITTTDQPEVRRAKYGALLERFYIANLIQNFYIPDRFGPGDPENRGPAALPKLLTNWVELYGDRPVLSFNFGDQSGAGSSLNDYFSKVA